MGRSTSAPAVRLGAHVSIAGGFELALERGREAACDVVQIFTKSNQQWAARPITDLEVERWRAARERTGVEPAIAHAAYLINLAAPTRVEQRRAVRALRLELERCRRLGIASLVIHPGAHRGAGVAVGIARAAALLDAAFADLPAAGPRLLLENTAGQGTGLGHAFAHLRDLLGAVREPARVGICLDSCHLFAAGHELRTAVGVRRLFDELDRVVGLEQLCAWHLNDSRGPLGCRRDRHAHIGHGQIGLGGFCALLNEPRQPAVPMVVELPKPIPEADRVNVALLRSLVGGRRVSARATKLLTDWRSRLAATRRR